VTRSPPHLVHTRTLPVVLSDAFWRALLPILILLPHRTATGTSLTGRTTPQPGPAGRVLTSHLVLFEDIDRPAPNEWLISGHPQTNEVGIPT
jgi:hypothetical protein